MKNILNYFMMGVAVLGMSAALASCQKENNTAPETPQAIEAPQAPEVHVIHVELNAAISDTKSEYDSGDKKVTIENGDQLYVVLTQPDAAGWSGATGTLTYDGTSFKGAITYTGTYEGSDIITAAKDLTATFLPKGYSAIGYLSATGVATAANAFYAGTKDASVPQLVHLTATVSDKAGVAKTPLTLVPQNAVLCYSINANKLSVGAHSVSVSDGTTTISGNVTAVADAATTFAVAFPASASEKNYTMSVVSYEKVVKTGKTLAAGKVVNIPVSALTPLFSVGAGKYVKFSLGNLQYNSNTQVWQFAEHQYTYVGNAAGNTSVTTDGIANNNGIVDLFGWVGASSNWTGLAQYGISSSKATDNVNGYGNVDYESLKSDWGTLIGTGWRTLTSAEWKWVLGPRVLGPSSSPIPGTNCRTSSTIGSTENARFVRATVHSTKGLILFPDEITWNATTMGGVPTTCNTDENDNFTYSPTDANWAALEAAGCVFLPAAGTRDGTSVGQVGSDGSYWSSTPLGSGDAFFLYFSSDYVSPASNLHRYYGHSVRLVQDQ